MGFFVFQVLQVIVQPLIERLIIQDRVLWLLENGHDSDMIPVFDDFISPRNIALCSNKLPWIFHFCFVLAYANNVSFVLPKLKINYLILTRLIQRGQFWVNHYIHLLELFFVLNWFILDHCILFSSFNSRFTKIWIRSMLKAKYVKRKKCLKRKKTYLNGFE